MSAQQIVIGSTSPEGLSDSTNFSATNDLTAENGSALGIDNPTIELDDEVERPASTNVVDTSAVVPDIMLKNNSKVDVDNPTIAKLLRDGDGKTIEVEMQERAMNGGEDGEARRKEMSGQRSDGDRETWGKKIDFLLSVIGFSVDLANVWRFPYICYRNGGGAFLIPYVLFLVIGGIPLLFMELSLGQFNREGAISVWKICPLFQGVGWAVVLMAWYVGFYYNVVIAWSFYYFFASFKTVLPWKYCDHAWNTESCFDESMNASLVDVGGQMTWINSSTGTSPAQEFFDYEMLRRNRSDGLHDLAGMSWQLPLCLLLVFVILYFSLWKGVKTSGKVVWVTATLPYFVLTILLIRGVTLPGAGDGIRFYLTPDFNRLATPNVWIDAAVQIFYSIGAGFGVHIAFASYNKFHSNVYRDAIFTSCINCFTSFFSGFAVFSILGYLALKTNKDISEVATEGPGLVFTVYPEAIAKLPGASFWSIIFYVMLITLGLDSSFGGAEAIITGLTDQFPRFLKNRREWLVLAVAASFFIFGLPNITYGGIYVFHLESEYAASTAILFAVAIEVIGVSWFYGVSRFSNDIREMIGSAPNIAWRICWKFISPTFILVMFIVSLVLARPLMYDAYVYPTWGNVIAWILAASSIVVVPITAVYQIASSPGAGIKEKFAYAITPRSDHALISNKGEIYRYKAQHWMSI